MSEALLHRHAREILDAALRECGIERVFDRKLRTRVEGGRTLLYFGAETLDLTDVRSLRIVAAGKAAAEMLTGFLSRVSLAPECDVRGVLIGRYSPRAVPRGFQFFAGGHPLPNQASFDGARAALALVHEASTQRGALCVFLISGGASAMMELPLDPAQTLEDTVALYRALVHSGATISEINCIRKHFSAVKGGRLALAAGATPSLTLLVSDVPPHQLDSLASGPTMPDTTTVEECRELLARYKLDQSLPQSVRGYFHSSSLQETVKPGDLHARIFVLLDSDDLGMAAEFHAKKLGYHTVVDNRCDDWGYADAARYLLDRLRVLRAPYDRVCVLSTGEVTVAVPNDLSAERKRSPGETHLGGRNQHFTLFAATLLTPSDESVCVLSAGSDGIDGNSDAAGGIIGNRTLEDARQLEDAKLALSAFDSFTFLHSLGATVVTGATGNNLRDLRVLLAERTAD